MARACQSQRAFGQLMIGGLIKAQRGQCELLQVLKVACLHSNFRGGAAEPEQSDFGRPESKVLAH